MGKMQLNLVMNLKECSDSDGSQQAESVITREQATIKLKVLSRGADSATRFLLEEKEDPVALIRWSNGPILLRQKSVNLVSTNEEPHPYAAAINGGHQEQPTHNLYEDDQGLDEEEDEKLERMRLLEFRLNSYHKFCKWLSLNELIKYFDKLGISLNEKYRLANVATDAVLDSVLIETTHRTNAMKMGQFERTLIVADDRSFVQYLEDRSFI
nr:hypothetical protein [Tanacetum cinerariifolium]